MKLRQLHAVFNGNLHAGIETNAGKQIVLGNIPGIAPQRKASAVTAVFQTDVIFHKVVKNVCKQQQRNAAGHRKQNEQHLLLGPFALQKHDRQNNRNRQKRCTAKRGQDAKKLQGKGKPSQFGPAQLMTIEVCNKCNHQKCRILISIGEKAADGQNIGIRGAGDGQNLPEFKHDGIQANHHGKQHNHTQEAIQRPLLQGNAFHRQIKQIKIHQLDDRIQRVINIGGNALDQIIQQRQHQNQGIDAHRNQGVARGPDRMQPHVVNHGENLNSKAYHIQRRQIGHAAKDTGGNNHRCHHAKQCQKQCPGIFIFKPVFHRHVPPLMPCAVSARKTPTVPSCSTPPRQQNRQRRTALLRNIR